jgi:hypothetical protein
MECAGTTLSTYKRVTKNVVSLLRPGGYIVLATTLGEGEYTVGEKVLHNTKLTGEDVEEALTEAGCVNIEWRLQPCHDGSLYDAYDTTAITVCMAQKSI